jgi:colicin import membrane protein
MKYPGWRIETLDGGSKTRAWIGAILVHIALLAVLVVSVRWKQEPPAVVSADLVVPPSKQPTTSPAPTPQPEPVPRPPPPPPTSATKSSTPKFDEAQIKRAEIEKNKELEQKQKEREVQEVKRKKDEKLAKEQAQKKETEKKQTDARTKDLADAKERALKEQREEKARQELAERNAREAQARLAAQEAADRAAKEAAARARIKAEGDWVAKIRGKIRGNIILASDVPGNPEAIFEVSLLPTGEVLDARLAKSSGNAAYDQAVERAILKSSPLPKPDQMDVFQRRLTLKFRPVE